MKALQTIIAIAALFYVADAFAQTEEVEDATSYKAEIFGSASSGSTTPFWMVSNRYGIVPLDAGNGYLNAGIFHQQHFGKGFRWSAGLDIIAAVPRYHNVFVQQVWGAKKTGILFGIIPLVPATWFFLPTHVRFRR